MTEDIHILRFGYHNRANLMPLLYPLEAGWVAPESPWKLEIVNDTPSNLQDALLDGRLDVAFVTPAAAQLHGSKIAPLGGWGLAAAGAAETALFLAPQRIDLIDGSDAAILPEAVSSSAEHILRTILSPYYDIKLNLHAPHDEGYDPKGARLLYSDNAARQAAANPKGWVADDMGVAWYVLTGLPMVWELLCAHRDLQTRKPGAPEAIQALMRLSQRSAREQQSTVLQEASSRLNLPQARVKELFARQSYTLATEEQKGLAHFLDMAARAKTI
ncbi:MAG: MqnA/MqnD/SBP family protein [Chloroflexota bacterium]